MRGFVVKGKAVLTSSNKNLKGWEQKIAKHFEEVRDGDVLEGPVAFHLRFSFAAEPAKRGTQMTKTPDLDKLVRAVLDGVTKSGVIEDDRFVVALVATKVYSDIDGVHVMITKRDTKGDSDA